MSFCRGFLTCKENSMHYVLEILTWNICVRSYVLRVLKIETQNVLRVRIQTPVSSFEEFGQLMACKRRILGARWLCRNGKKENLQREYLNSCRYSEKVGPTHAGRTWTRRCLTCSRGSGRTPSATPKRAPTPQRWRSSGT